jgi:hypothetical protein
MAYSTVYYWRIDEVSNGGKTIGTAWRFKTTSPGPGSPPSLPPPLDRTATFQLKNGVVIKGGYASFGQPDPDARDPNIYETILSGDLAGNDEPNFVNYEENSSAAEPIQQLFSMASLSLRAMPTKTRMSPGVAAGECTTTMVVQP